ncbi:MAG: DUF3180 domain-containing protein [Segniliparus sp.]|uniref:DUF3180 domain-containing protein n=1 Tax=Segniliparus sp. TaxID=2804064 RepID=UPI003F3A21D8
MKQIGFVECVGCALVGVLVALCWPGLRTMPVAASAGVPLLAAGLVEAGLGSYLRARVRDNRIGVGPGLVPPVFVARAGALAAASVFAGAFVLGFWAALGMDALLHKGQLLIAERNLPGGLIGVFCSAALVAGALWLRRCCRAPHGGHDDPRGGASSGAGS